MEEEKPEGEEVVEEKSNVEKVTENYDSLKAANDKVEAELLRGEQLKMKAALGGKTSAGQPIKTSEEEQEETRKKDVEEIVNAFN